MTERKKTVLRTVLAKGQGRALPNDVEYVGRPIQIVSALDLKLNI